MKNGEIIHEFCSRIQQRIEEVLAVELLLHKRILIVTLLDSLVWARYPEYRYRGSNQERFTKFVEDCVDWPEATRVSLPQLSFLLRQTARASAQLVEAVGARISAWSGLKREPTPLDDPLVPELCAIAQNSDDNALIKLCRHSKLLYDHRSALVHEFRVPGYDPGAFTVRAKPYYWMLLQDGQWHLVYPVEFLGDIINSGLSSLRRHMEDNDLDPYQGVSFSAVWKRPRNESEAAFEVPHPCVVCGAPVVNATIISSIGDVHEECFYKRLNLPPGEQS